MIKKLIALVAFCTVITAAGKAEANCDGLYLAGRAGIINHNFGDGKDTFGSRWAIDDNAWSLTGAIGYRWRAYWRAEAQYSWREKQSKNENFYGLITTTEFQTYSYMLNLYYDFSPYTMFTPYVMAGAGITQIQLRQTGGGMLPRDYDRDVFTWSLGAGLSIKMTNRWNIDFGYTFYHMDKFGEATVRAHEGYVGTRYVF